MIFRFSWLLLIELVVITCSKTLHIGNLSSRAGSHLPQRKRTHFLAHVCFVSGTDVFRTTLHFSARTLLITFTRSLEAETQTNEIGVETAHSVCHTQTHTHTHNYSQAPLFFILHTRTLGTTHSSPWYSAVCSYNRRM